MTSHDAMYGSQSDNSPRLGDGYKIEIASVRKMIDPLEESVVAARKVKDHKDRLAADLQGNATFEILDSGKSFLSAWGFGMGQVADHADEVVARLHEVIAAYILAELLGVKNFSPTPDNISKLPVGDAGKWTWENVGKPTFDPPKKLLQEEWPPDPTEVSA
ncbi:hypothetical protein ACIOJD_12075 [Streptomyces sp. NPDC088116]|uniref:hypothetical protein n=1 Tax=Streptomyces sp. NPDC088116 TaxID=3365825 RepID=UPI0038150BFA